MKSDIFALKSDNCDFCIIFDLSFLKVKLQFLTPSIDISEVKKA